MGHADDPHAHSKCRPGPGGPLVGPHASLMHGRAYVRAGARARRDGEDGGEAEVDEVPVDAGRRGFEYAKWREHRRCYD